MFLASLTFSGWNWLWPAAGAMCVALLLLIWNYRAAPRGIVRWVCLGLKLLGLAALALCLLEPLWSGQRAKPGANLLAIVADNSQGLQIKDRGETRSRGELLRDLLDPQRARWQGTLEENFEVRRYFFDARLQTTKDFGELVFDGRASAIGATLRTLAERYRNRPLAGVLLLTDGNATDLRAAPELAGLPPIYPVVIGEREPARDIAVQQTHVSQTDFEDAPVSVQAEVTAAGYRGEAIAAQLLDSSGKKVEEKTLRARKDNEPLAFRFQFRPAKAGLSFYRLRVGAKNEVEAPGAQKKSEEATLANNSRVLVVDRGRGPYRILYVAGRPNWEFKFLNRAVQEDEQLQLVGLIRVAKREPKFNFRLAAPARPAIRSFAVSATSRPKRSNATISPCWSGSTRAMNSSCEPDFPARPKTSTAITR